MMCYRQVFWLVLAAPSHPSTVVFITAIIKSKKLFMLRTYSYGDSAGLAPASHFNPAKAGTNNEAQM
jgi:hypothetical protein